MVICLSKVACKSGSIVYCSLPAFSPCQAEKNILRTQQDPGIMNKWRDCYIPFVTAGVVKRALMLEMLTFVRSIRVSRKPSDVSASHSLCCDISGLLFV